MPCEGVHPGKAEAHRRHTHILTAMFLLIELSWGVGLKVHQLELRRAEDVSAALPCAALGCTPTKADSEFPTLCRDQACREMSISHGWGIAPMDGMEKGLQGSTPNLHKRSGIALICLST